MDGVCLLELSGGTMNTAEEKRSADAGTEGGELQ